MAFTVFSLYFCANFKIKKYFDNDLNKNDKTITNFFNTTTTQIDTTATIQIDNIRGGNVPNYIFVGLLPSANLQGAYDKGATCFKQHNVEELNITLSGNSVSGYNRLVEVWCDRKAYLWSDGHWTRDKRFTNVFVLNPTRKNCNT